AHDHRRAHDPLLDHARPVRGVRARLPRPDGGRRGVRAEDPEHEGRGHGRGHRAGLRAPCGGDPGRGEAARDARDRGRVAPLLRVARPLRDLPGVRLLAAQAGRGRAAHARRFPLLQRHQRHVGRRGAAARDGRGREGGRV
ncbi:MAG: UDP-N-acetylglucosamine 4,6-dehydratase (inverting), partial [uncultured Thermomicrobiales bacterium]